MEFSSYQDLYEDNLYIVPNQYIHIFETLYDNYENLFDSRDRLSKNLSGRISPWYWHGEYVIPFQFSYHNILDKITRIDEIKTKIIR